MEIAIDGHYGEHSHYKYFDKSVFITGGTGISGPYAIAKDLVENLPYHEVKLYWSVRHLDDIRDYLQELLVFKDNNVKPVIYVSNFESSTSGSGSGSGSESSDCENKEEYLDIDEITKNNDDLQKALRGFEIIAGRMPVIEVIDKEIVESKTSNVSVAFGLCAHPEVVDIARHHISHNLNANSKRIKYFEEMQQW